MLFSLVLPLALHATVPAALPPADSVRQLRVAIVLFTSSFNKTLTRAEIERVHEEVAEFYAFYQQHGAGRVDFDFSLVQVDRRLARREIDEVAPGRYYLSREDVERELAARGFRGRFDEVIALHAWSNANADRAAQAYGGGAVGPDGNFLGDAGFNSIPVMGRDPATIGQVLIHEVLHNIADMFSRSGMPGEFFNADEMSRNMPQLLRERPGAFLPLYSDADMLAYADRERQGREAYPWAMQLVYYAWMLERTPTEGWNRLRYGRMMRREAPAVRPLYSSIYTSAANDSVYVVELGRSRLAERRFTQRDFDGSPIYTGTFHAAWLPVPRADSGAAGLARVVRQRVAAVAADPDVVRYLDAAGPPPSLGARVLADRCCGEGPVLDAPVAVAGDTSAAAPHTVDLTLTASLPGWYVHQARVRLTVRRSWSVRDDGPVVAPTGAPVTLNAFIRQDRGIDDADVRATLLGHSIPLVRSGDGRYTAVIDSELPFGLHWARVEARGPGGAIVPDSFRVYIRPAGWIRAPDTFTRAADGSVRVATLMWSRMGVPLRQPLPLVAIAGDDAVPLSWRADSATYDAVLHPPAGVDRIVLASLLGDPQRRVVRVTEGGRAVERSETGGQAVRRSENQEKAADSVPVFASAVQLVRPPVIDGDLADWPATRAAPVRIDHTSYLLTDSSRYRGDADCSGTIRFGWDDTTLYVAGSITDDSVTSGEAWNVDRVNLVFDMKHDTSPITYSTGNPPMEQWQDDDYWVYWRYGGRAVGRSGKTTVDSIPGARLATRRTAAGWDFEVAIPRAALPGYVPVEGQVAGLQVFITDGDGGAKVNELMWSDRWPYPDGIEWHLDRMAHLLFVGAPAGAAR